MKKKNFISICIAAAISISGLTTFANGVNNGISISPELSKFRMVQGLL